MSTKGNDGQKYKVVVIGGGPAGFFSAIRIASLTDNVEVIILEGGIDVLQKVKISGGGRCNVTNGCSDPGELSQYYPRGRKELRGPFNRFHTVHTRQWFEAAGVALKEEHDGRVFPVSDDSQTIVDTLLIAARKYGIETYLRSRVDDIVLPLKEGAPITITTQNGRYYYADFVIVATGSSNYIWNLLSEKGYTITKPVPSLFSFNLPEDEIVQLQGVSLETVRVSIPAAKLETTGPMIITHWGMSGPAILKASAFAARELFELDYETPFYINWTNTDFEPTKVFLSEFINSHKQGTISSAFPWNIPKRLKLYLLKKSGIDMEMQWANISKKQINKLLEIMTRDEYIMKGKTKYKDEFVVAGGVHLKQIDFKTFGSKLHPYLFFAGEILDIDGVTGGFNFQAAWTAGWIAGESIAERINAMKEDSAGSVPS